MPKDFNVFGYVTLIKQGTDIVGPKGKNVKDGALSIERLGSIIQRPVRWFDHGTMGRERK